MRGFFLLAVAISIVSALSDGYIIEECFSTEDLPPPDLFGCREKNGTCIPAKHEYDFL